jgi:thiamine pyrophosphate-dependent acetolactate synthase large subunit-like protein
MLAKACGCNAERPNGIESFKECVRAAFDAEKPTLIVVRENEEWLR